MGIGVKYGSERGILGAGPGVEAVAEVVFVGVVVTGFVPIFLSSWSIVFDPVLESLPGNEAPVLSATTGVAFIKPIDINSGAMFVSKNCLIHAIILSKYPVKLRVNTRTISKTTITLNTNHHVDGGASPLELATDAASDGDKTDNSLLDLNVIPSSASASASISGPFVALVSSGFLSSRLSKKLKNEDLPSSLACASSPPFSIPSDRFRELDLDFGFDLVLELDFSFIIIKYNYKIFNDLVFFIILFNYFLYNTILNNTIKIKMNSFIVSSILLVLIDLIYLYFVGKPVFDKTVAAIQNSSLVVNIAPAIFTYILMVVLLNYFIISVNKSAFDAFILGFCTYGIFEFTNMTIFKKYNLKTAITDTLWGAILFFSVTTITYYLKKVL
jgi:uncharacterized membrane protein